MNDLNEAVKKARQAGLTLNQNFADDAVWRKLASHYDVVMPQWHLPASQTKHVKAIMKQLGLDSTWLRNHTQMSIKEFCNSSFDNAPAWAVVGLLLETLYYSEHDTLDLLYK